MRVSSHFHWLGIFVYLAAPCAAHGQQAAASPEQQVDSPPLQLDVPAQATLQSFQTGQQTLAQSFSALMAQGPTPFQMQAWQQQNAVAIENQQQLALDLAAESEAQPQPLVNAPNLPPNASATLTDFLTTQANVANARAQIHNQLLAALPLDVTAAQLGQMQQSEAQLFLQQQGANLQLQTQRSQALANAAAQQPQPLPPPLAIPPGATAALSAFLTARDQLQRDQITFANQYVNATPAVRDAALAQWSQQNAARFQQVQQLAQNLSPTTSIPSN